jgi:hypothetical protein
MNILHNLIIYLELQLQDRHFCFLVVMLRTSALKYKSDIETVPWLISNRMVLIVLCRHKTIQASFAANERYALLSLARN